MSHKKMVVRLEGPDEVEEEVSVSGHDDAQTPELAFRAVMELLRGAHIVQEIPRGSQQQWTPAQEAHLQALVEQIRKVQRLHRQSDGWWRLYRKLRARERLVDQIMAGKPELLNEAELRYTKSQMLVGVLLEFACSALQPDDVQRAILQMEAVQKTTYEDLKPVGINTEQQVFETMPKFIKCRFTLEHITNRYRNGEFSRDDLYRHVSRFLHDPIVREWWELTRPAHVPPGDEESEIRTRINDLIRQLDESGMEEWWIVGERMDKDPG
ncbi:DUF6082 family protein [Streptomyces sp. NPDC002309]